MSSLKKSFLFDLNGTMIDDMSYHAKAWYHILNNELGVTLSYEEVKSHMYGKNSELLIRIFGKDHFSNEQIETLSIEKERGYQKEYFPHLKLINGLGQFLEKAKQHQIPMAIGSAAITFNIDFVVDNLNIRHYLGAVVSADDVENSKPDPETFLKAAQMLGVDPVNSIVFEDAPKGVESAKNAGMKCVVLTTMHEEHEFSQYDNILFFIKDYTELEKLDQLF